jgi:putative membrane protein
MFLRSFQDERVRRKVILPLALALIVFSTFSIMVILFNFPDISWAVVFLTLGIYIIVKAYNLDEPIKAMSQNAKTAVTTIPFAVLAGIIVIAGIVTAWNEIQAFDDYWLRNITLFSILLWTGVFAIILLGMGRALQLYTKDNEFPWIFFPIVFSVLSFGSFIYGVLELSTYLLGFAGSVTDVFIFWTLGIFFAMLSYLSYSSVREHKAPPDWHQ